MATGLERTAISPHTMQAGQLAPQRPSLAQTAISPLARAYQAYQQYVGQPFQQAVRGGVRGYFGLPLMTDASSVGREAYRQGEALGFTPGVGMPAGAVRMAAEGMQALPSIAGDISRMIGGLPSAAAARQAEDFAAYQRSIPPSDVSPLTAFHGTPHTFAAEEGAPLGRFRSEKIGSGEGAQMYGHGLYFAENPNVAGTYRSELSSLYGTPTTIKGAGQEVEIPLWVADKIEKEGLDSVIDEWTKRLNEIKESIPNSSQPWIAENNAARFEKQIEAFKAMKKSGEGKVQQSGSLYTVDIPDAMVDKMLDWDKPLKEQSKAIQDIANRLGTNLNLAGRALYNQAQLKVDLGDGPLAPAASQWFRSQGIPGIRYLDEGSRTAGEGTRNIVVFPGEEQNVKILSRE
jgi:hypothetical protein